MIERYRIPIAVAAGLLLAWLTLFARLTLTLFALLALRTLTLFALLALRVLLISRLATRALVRAFLHALSKRVDAARKLARFVQRLDRSIATALADRRRGIV